MIYFECAPQAAAHDSTAAYFLRKNEEYCLELAKVLTEWGKDINCHLHPDQPSLILISRPKYVYYEIKECCCEKFKTQINAFLPNEDSASFRP